MSLFDQSYLDDHQIDDDLAVDAVEERLKQLKPSSELLNFYRQKIAEFDGEHVDMLSKLERYKLTFEEQVRHDDATL
jgi:coiled-coil domain-containing protein 77